MIHSQCSGSIIWRSLILVTPLCLLLGTGCQVARTTHVPTHKTSRNAEWALREQIKSSAAKHIGTRYKYAGTSPQTGFDCSGFTSYILGQVDIHLPHQSALQAQTGEATPVDKLQTGDLIYFSREGRIFHVALVETNEEEGITVIHSTSSRGVVRENVSQSSYWKSKVAGGRNVIGANMTASR